MPTKGAVVYGTIYAPLGEVRTNGQSFTVNQGRVIALDFLQNGNGGGFSASIVGDPYAQPTYAARRVGRVGDTRRLQTGQTRIPFVHSAKVPAYTRIAGRGPGLL